MSRILNRKANWNNAEVGSHVLLKPVPEPGQPAYEPMVHHLMAYFQGGGNAEGLSQGSAADGGVCVVQKG
jgi:hypothetical protein